MTASMAELGENVNPTGTDSFSYSVLMPVYAGEKPEYFRTAIQSMLDQTVPPDEMVIVCDGPLTTGLERIIQGFSTVVPGKFRIVRLKEHAGVGQALNAGLKVCRNDLVARMDSDDIALVDRCRIQLDAFRRNPRLALLSGDIAEFETDPDDARCIRHVPRTHEEILRFARKRNPMNHMAVMYRRSEVERAGGYIDISYAEDYYLWVRMLQNGCLAENIGTILVKARTGDGIYRRRGGAEYAKNICALQKKFLQMRFISYREFLTNCTVRAAVSLVPVKVRREVYRRHLRRRC